MSPRKLLCSFGVAAGLILAMLTLSAGRKSMSAPAREAAGPHAEVRIDNFTFGPQTLTVPAGTTVTWTNGDDIPHNVVSEKAGFKSQALDTDEKFSYAFDKPGAYDYFCGIHPKMIGKVVVQ